MLLRKLELKMPFDSYLENLKELFPEYGHFEYRLGENLRSTVASAKVPNLPGVYLFCAPTQVSDKWLYIGKAGTILTDGSLRDQGLKKRIPNRHDGESRQKFLEEKMGRLGLSAIRILWFVTFNQQTKLIPAKTEADLLQAYFEENGKLPPWNKGI